MFSHPLFLFSGGKDKLTLFCKPKLFKKKHLHGSYYGVSDGPLQVITKKKKLVLSFSLSFSFFSKSKIKNEINPPPPPPRNNKQAHWSPPPSTTATRPLGSTPPGTPTSPWGGYATCLASLRGARPSCCSSPRGATTGDRWRGRRWPSSGRSGGRSWTTPWED